MVEQLVMRVYVWEGDKFESAPLYQAVAECCAGTGWPAPRSSAA